MPMTSEPAGPDASSDDLDDDAAGDDADLDAAVGAFALPPGADP